MDSLRILQIVPRIAAESSGPSVSVPSLSESLAELGHDVSLFTLQPEPKSLLFKKTSFFPTRRLPFCHRLGVSPAMKRAIRDAMPGMDIVHTNSLWMMPNIYPGTIRDRGKCKLVISPRGTISDWALSRARLRKGIVWRLGQRQTLESADCIHVTSPEEMEEVRKLGLTNPIAVIPNGVACPENYDTRSKDRDERTCLFLARIHPKKGIDHLVKVWSAVASRYRGWRLVIAGPLASSYAAKLQDDVKKRRVPRVEFSGEVTGHAKARLFQNSDLYVLPTHSENFGISVAEALSYGVPSIVYHGAPWSKLNEKNAGWWIEPKVDALAQTLQDAMALSDEQRESMGRNAHEWVKSDYDWTKIGQRTSDVHQWLCHRDLQVPCDVYLS